MKSAIEKQRDYWEGRYIHDLPSGCRKEYKVEWRIINEFLPEIDDVLDIGCGDLKLWKGQELSNYVGVDISPTLIYKNKLNRPEWGFICAPAEEYIHYLSMPNVFCLNTLFHIMHTDNFNQILENLRRYATETIFISTWDSNPFIQDVTDGRYQHYHPFNPKIFEKFGFKLEKHIILVYKGKHQTIIHEGGIKEERNIENIIRESRKGYYFFKKC